MTKEFFVLIGTGVVINQYNKLMEYITNQYIASYQIRNDLDSK
jgi:hypothetical protein